MFNKNYNEKSILNSFCRLPLLIMAVGLFVACTKIDVSLNDNQDSVSTEVTLEQAQQELEQILGDIYTQTKVDGAKKKVIANSFTIKEKLPATKGAEQVEAAVYAFNFADDGGYALMSGDSRVPSLMCMTDGGNISPTDEIDNPGVAIFLDGMEDVYNDGVSQPAEKSVGRTETGAWTNKIYKEGGYCPVQWGQGYPYNIYCPMKDGRSTYTGCVATAVAQIMATFKYPPYYDDCYFNWNDMTAIQFPYTSSAQNQVARLMAQLGEKKNLKMKYGVDGSEASRDDIPRTLKNFGYSSCNKPKNYNESDVVTDLEQGYPIILAGNYTKHVTRFLGIRVRKSYRDGHDWIGHGLMERSRTIKKYDARGKLTNTTTEREWYILCNWGWGGHDDGYYLSKAFNAKNGPTYPNTKGSTYSDTLNFKYNLEAITGIRR